MLRIRDDLSTLNLMQERNQIAKVAVLTRNYESEISPISAATSQFTSVKKPISLCRYSLNQKLIYGIKESERKNKHLQIRQEI